MGDLTRRQFPPAPAGQLQELCASLGEIGATHPLTSKSASSLAAALCLSKSGTRSMAAEQQAQPWVMQRCGLSELE